jgi:hypothetical protein
LKQSKCRVFPALQECISLSSSKPVVFFAQWVNSRIPVELPIARIVSYIPSRITRGKARVLYAQTQHLPSILEPLMQHTAELSNQKYAKIALGIMQLTPFLERGVIPTVKP